MTAVLSATHFRRNVPGVPPDVGTILKEIAEPRTGEEPKEEAPCHLVLHNDDFNSFGFVATVLTEVLGYPLMKSIYLAIRVHLQGAKPIWTGARRDAEDRARRIRASGPDPEGAPRLAPRPLTVTVEAA